MEMQQTHYYTTGTATLPWKCNKLIITQQELLRYHGNAIWCIDHVTKEKPNMSQYYFYPTFQK
jgi:hypothetical protein